MERTATHIRKESFFLNSVKILFPTLGVRFPHQSKNNTEGVTAETSCQPSGGIADSLASSPRVLGSSSQPTRTSADPIEIIDGLRIFSREVNPEVHGRFREVRERLEPALIEYLCGKRVEFRPLGLQPLLVGVDETNTKPYIVVTCHFKAKRKVKNFLNEDFVKHICWGSDICQVRFDTKVVGRAPRPLEGDDLDDVFMAQGGVEDPEPWPRMIKVVQQQRAHYAMMGGYVSVIDFQGKRSVYGLTAGHVLLPCPLHARSSVQDSASDSNEGSEPESDEVWSTTESEGDTEEEATSGEDLGEMDNDKDHENWACVGRMSNVSHLARARDRDWALIELDTRKDGSLSTAYGLGSKYYEAACPIGGQRVVIANEVRTACVVSHSQARAILPSGNTFINVTVLQLPSEITLHSGSSGSWVVDPDSVEPLKVYGMLVAADPFGCIWMVPMVDILSDIKHSLNAAQVSLTNTHVVSSDKPRTSWLSSSWPFSMGSSAASVDTSHGFEEGEEATSEFGKVALAKDDNIHLGSPASTVQVDVGNEQPTPWSPLWPAAVPEPISTQISNKRVTRSSTKSSAPVEPTLGKSTHVESKAPKARSKGSTANREQNKLKKERASDAKSKSPKSKSSITSAQDQSQDAASGASNVETTTITSDLIKNPIQCALYASSTPSSKPSSTLVFTHGAGGTLSAPAVVNFCTGFSTALSVLALQGSMNLGSRVKGFHACIEHLKEKDQKEDSRLVLGGRSMGARAAVMAASELFCKDSTDRKVDLILVSYPLQGPKDTRDQILLDLPASVNVLFIIGDRDSMCPLDLLNEVRGKMKAKNQLVIVREADHGMHTKPAKLEREIGEETGRMAASWVAGNMEDEVVYIGEEG
ncbi:hypothetical protein EK21DRAFT_63352 [Setomelanomma holmii]|uniref:KANL3/Tex30 alpha/beta hydrolase-like domain-containing protein n=1 Tax=Setomelanomma holmii TaxID=210430 RepID=A0A9P4HC81_9PLEO|nr:hypothetical protein EK21DRAFT_63352 [Setomelanomma holmii]